MLVSCPLRNITRVVHDKADRLVKAHCLPLEMSLKRLSPCYILPRTNNLAIGMIKLV